MEIVKVLYPSVLKTLTVLLVVGTGAAALAEPYVPPAGLGAPGRRESAGTRGCAFGNPANLIALMPTDNVGLTTAAYPRFYWYMPTTQASFVRFTLERMGEDTEGMDSAEEIYRTQFAITGEPGIMSLELPDTVSLPALEAGDRYHWQVAVFCNPVSENGDLQIEGWVERQTPDEDLLAALEMASESEKVALYASNGYWFDVVDQLATLQAEAPEDSDLQARWAELLESVDLEHLANQPFVSVE